MKVWTLVSDSLTQLLLQEERSCVPRSRLINLDL